ncbi:hypothetical protein EV200_106204 [Pedobacter psychrotolerans]|uniref:Uncharacterized protein n=1 Tax=Pedobacter psychrotolerans TaxID=1843235 RepID=A0A4V2RYY8_9SPHI|nr:hypothetical protein EV200_106204 [Pedobacter psychrotolerans]GGE65520.1 hypothetical protein GCM10011413_34970 [Pedobacter psychrotolerans]
MLMQKFDMFGKEEESIILWIAPRLGLAKFEANDCITINKNVNFIGIYLVNLKLKLHEQVVNLTVMQSFKTDQIY